MTGVTSAVAHPGFATSRAYDVAVLRLSTPTVAPPIPLASPADDASYVFNGQALSVAGFGSRNPLTFGKPKLGTLMATGITVLNLCRLDPRFVPQAQICARGRPINRYLASGSCVGDSGGPMAGLTDAGPRLFGISSSVYRSNRGLQKFIRCGNRKLASVYSRVAASYGFILANL